MSQDDFDKMVQNVGKGQKLTLLLQRVSKVPIPETELERARLFAYELALGVNEGI